GYELDVLRYATKHLSMHLLARREHQDAKPFNLGKVTSFLGAQQMLDYIAHDNHEKLPIFIGGDQKGVGKATVAKFISKRLETEFGVSITPITLYKAYADASKNIFKVR